MEHNRPYYGKKVCVLIEDIDKDFCLRNLPRWIEQNYENYFILIVGDEAYYTDISRISSRYGVETKVVDEHNLSGKCLLCKNPEDFFDKIECDFFIPSPSNASPLPYYLDILMMKINSLQDFDYKKKSIKVPCETVSKNMLMNHGDVMDEKVSLFIPVMNRQKNVEDAFDTLSKQTYSNYELVYIDYSSEVPLIGSLEKLCEKYRKTISYNEPKSNTFVKCLRIDNQEFFNISHAYNFAIKQVETDIVSTICADSVPWDYYVETCANLVDDKTLVQIHWGLHTITKKNWAKLNGHQEFIVGWGGEDDDFRIRASLMGLNTISLPDKIVYQIPQKSVEKGVHRKIKDISESSLTNIARFQQYIARHGYVGNYGVEIGNEKPIEYRPDAEIEKPLRLWCFRKLKTTCEEIKYSETFKLHYIVGNKDIDCSKYADGPFYHYYIHANVDVDKYLSQVP